ncbi:unnamed protein product [Aphanomyces euteiches]|uniref:GH18 domain-containing protein n=2 Tax=Aphanomyces euteiches TaxID=100861 RepID=A0A6G0WYB2_9STRA|nr:hypothetical protein Ae201684_010279 [Aphanomyces euteiches]KAH9090573.1 hypothetical protein Ae201684P_014371 [Aphanomyces euteiches]KAH9137966.1 hypothetical protein AeRB84_017567 [Aphanomyces euteiches]KAH9137975.1 hypothetical protein AeRB84_017543 [Aphanomyces euteiches]KAH9149549.1 hypothetical protein AeRB84_007404 [Aphanomyces euteiches]
MVKRGCHWWPLVLAAVVVGGATVLITYLTKSGVFAPKTTSENSISSSNTTNSTKQNTTCTTRGMYLDANNSCTACPQPNKTFAVFWQSYTDGCQEFIKSDAFKYVTHVYWGFALIDNQTGAVSQSFQGNDATLLSCVKAMQKKCVQQYASIGGATERANFIALNTSEKIATFGKTAATLVTKFGFDGIDVDDESGNTLAGGNWNANTGSNVVAYLQSIRKELGALPRNASEPEYKITWDEFPTSLSANCNASSGDYQRCFDPRIGQAVDQVNIMMYNSALSSDYDTLLNSTIPTLWTQSVSYTKLVLGGCVGKPGDEGACSYGASPSSSQLSKYASDGATKYGGTMLWTGSADYVMNKGTTMTSMGQAGGYGIVLP